MYRKNKYQRVGTLCALLLSPLISFAESPSGSWRFDVEYELIGIPQTFPSYQITQCLNMNTPYPNISRPGHECQLQLQGRFGRTYTWMVNCSTDWEMVQGAGRIHFNGKQASGDVHLQILNPHNPPQHMVFHIKGQHQGNCKD